jgi:hypothetical protein
MQGSDARQGDNDMNTTFKRGDIVTYTDGQGRQSAQTVTRVELQDRYYSDGPKLRFYTLAPLGLTIIDGQGMAL